MTETPESNRHQAEQIRVLKELLDVAESGGLAGFTAILVTRENNVRFVLSAGDASPLVLLGALEIQKGHVSAQLKTGQLPT